MHWGRGARGTVRCYDDVVDDDLDDGADDDVDDQARAVGDAYSLPRF